ncbi:MAG: WGR domain-containing protein, partial [Thermodesulfovibrionales bacterium]
MQASFLDVPKELCQKADLHCSNGNSDKVYHTTIEQKDGGYVVLFAYGRRGDTLTRGTKTQEPVPYEKAIGVFNRLVSEKTAKGYISTPGISGDVFPSVRAQTLSSPEPLNTKKKMADVVAQLLTPITEDDAEGYLSDSAYGAQEKKDGKRLLVKSNGTDDIVVLNRNSVIIETSPYIKNAVLSLG